MHTSLCSGEDVVNEEAESWLIGFADLALIECNRGEEAWLDVGVRSPGLAVVGDGCVAAEVAVVVVELVSPFDAADMLEPSIQRSEKVHMGEEEGSVLLLVMGPFGERS